ncbi:hypothetical protein BLNAU_19495 [Blattamonas nauphoetae]|uniref:Uncharacterized protein n=1 Tax=Blattamonas nauphoetae TaxID=2049346 RepID=A0ABQ9X1F0_9EUKA|nr:hypothetical protein BLNAU_19495 [Blattamonas nauphoetae]
MSQHSDNPTQQHSFVTVSPEVPRPQTTVGSTRQFVNVPSRPLNEFRPSTSDKDSLLGKVRMHEVTFHQDPHFTNRSRPGTSIPSKPKLRQKTASRPESAQKNQPNVPISVVYRKLETLPVRSSVSRPVTSIAQTRTISDLPHPPFAVKSQPRTRSGTANHTISSKTRPTTRDMSFGEHLSPERSTLSDLLPPEPLREEGYTNDIPTWLGVDSIQNVIDQTTVSPIFEALGIKSDSPTNSEDNGLHMASDKLWRSILSDVSKKQGSSREDTALLSKWLDYQIMQIKKTQNTKREYYGSLQQILGRSMNELVRQISVMSNEHGKLLTHVWMCYLMCFEDMVTDIVNNRNDTTKRIQQESDTKIKELTEKNNSHNLSMHLSHHEQLMTLRDQNRALLDKIHEVQQLLSQREHELFDERSKTKHLEQDVIKLQNVLANSLKAIERMDTSGKPSFPNTPQTGSLSRLHSLDNVTGRPLSTVQSRYNTINQNTTLESLSSLDDLGEEIDEPQPTQPRIKRQQTRVFRPPHAPSSSNLRNNAAGSSSGQGGMILETQTHLTVNKDDCEVHVEEFERDGEQLKNHIHYFPGRFVDLDELAQFEATHDGSFNTLDLTELPIAVPEISVEQRDISVECHLLDQLGKGTDESESLRMQQDSEKRAARNAMQLSRNANNNQSALQAEAKDLDTALAVTKDHQQRMLSGTGDPNEIYLPLVHTLLNRIAHPEASPKATPISSGTMLSILTVLAEFVKSLLAVTTQLTSTSSTTSCVCIAMDSSQPLIPPVVSVRGLNDVVQAIGEGNFVDFTAELEQKISTSVNRRVGGTPQKKRKKDKTDSDSSDSAPPVALEAPEDQLAKKLKSRKKKKTELDPLAEAAPVEKVDPSVLVKITSGPSAAALRFLPTCFLSIITLVPDFFPRIMTLQQLRMEIFRLYSEKMEADRVDNVTNRTRTSFVETVYDYYLFNQGIRNLADIRVIDLIGSVRKFARYSSRVRLFGRFCGMLTPFHLEEDPEMEQLLALSKQNRPATQQDDELDQFAEMLRDQIDGDSSTLNEEEKGGDEDYAANLHERRVVQGRRKKKFDLYQQYKEMEETNKGGINAMDLKKYQDDPARNEQAIKAMLAFEDESVFPFPEEWPESAIDFALNFLSIVLNKGSALSLPTLSTADELWSISSTRALECVRSGFAGMPSQSLERITSVVQKIGAKGIVNVDEIVEASVLEYMQSYNLIASKFSNILAFTAFKEKKQTIALDKERQFLRTHNLDMLESSWGGGGSGKESGVSVNVGIWGTTMHLEEQFVQIARLSSALSADAVVSFDEFRSLLKLFDPQIEERVIVRMFRHGLLSSKSSSISPASFLSTCRSFGLFGSAAGKLETMESVIVSAEMESKQLQKMLKIVWTMAEPFFERRLLEIGTRGVNIRLKEFGDMRNKIAEVGRIVGENKMPMKGMREFRKLCLELAFLGEGILLE